MDRQERTLNVVKALNSYNSGNIPMHKLLDEVCDFFDFIKDEELDDSDKRFLIYLSNKVGVPQYYDVLDKFNSSYSSSIDDENIGLSTFSSLFYESSLFTDEDSKLHKFQMDILNLFEVQKQNRYFLSASTSFGKTHLVYEVIKKMKYKNIVLIFPSIALLSENLSKIKEGRIVFPLDYKIHTLSDIDSDYGIYNIFIFTPERFLSFLDKNNTSLLIDFIFVDEVYKIDNGYVIDDEAKENERDVAYRMAIFYGLSQYTKVDLLLAGPYIEIFEKKSPGYNPSFDLFLNDFKITKLLRNEYEIVKVSKTEIENVKTEINIDGVNFDFTKKKTKRSRMQEILDQILLADENAIVYCNTQANAEKVANEYERSNIDTNFFQAFIDHLKNKYDNRWVVIESLEKGIAVHHGVVPKYIQKEIVNLFNTKESNVNILTSTTTITEGVNTTAKNMIVYKSEKGAGTNGKPLLTFDAKNIAGRAGRFMEHFKGRVISLEEEFLNVINEVGNQIEHKNYQLLNERKEIDDEMTPLEYLNETSKQRLAEIKILQEDRDIPEEILSQFKVISKRDKIKIYDAINNLNAESHKRINTLIHDLNSGPFLVLNQIGFQEILDVIKELTIENNNLYFLIERKYNTKKGETFSVLIASLVSYIYNGYEGVYSYNFKRLMDNINKRAEDATKKNKLFDIEKETKNAVNSAMRITSTLVFNTFKYQLVKYIGVFNLMYKFYISKQQNKDFADVIGIDKLLIKLEYNAFTPEARTASDYGVPQNIINYYDSNNESERRRLLDRFDNYEKQIYQRIKKIIEE
ncbi:helicase-related protein [Flavobacterium luteolum]|uniref:helicase-related protein n=1 Tax=Flavobacterium luteolum TaxID=3003259 RepID=UPI00248E1726|nr:helicase-related protein [Flavobacterium luteolum]